MTREEWLLAGVEVLRDRLPILPPLQVSVGIPKGSRKALGQAWTSKLAGDQKTISIFVSPKVSDPVDALRILLHELVHAAVGIEAKHGAPFSQMAKKLGFVAPWTQGVMGTTLALELKELAGDMPAYPHVTLGDPAQKQTTRLKLWECACTPPVKIRRAGGLNAKCLDCGELFESKEDA